MRKAANSRVKLFTVLLAAACLIMAFGHETTSWAGAYQPCSVPPVVGSATRPNVVIVMDFSGSMQFPAYFDENFGNYYGSGIADCYETDVYKTYDPTYSYYGTFESDKYYVYESNASASTEYFRLATPQPVSQYTFTAESKDGGGGTSIEFTAAGHNFQVGDLVALYDLTSHKSLNGNAYSVTAVSGDRFKIAKPWNGKPDKDAGYAIKRIYGSLVPDSSGNVVGVSGNVLNLSVTSRTDASLKALIGGKAICPSGDNYCYLRAQGSRRLVKDNTNLQAEFYVRPTSIEATTAYPNNPAYPDDYDRGSYYKDEENHERDVVVSITGKYSGSLTATSPVYYTKYFAEWTFTLTKRTRVLMTLDGSWPGNDYIAIYTQPLAHMGDDNTYRVAYDDNSSPATIDTYLNAGTYYVRATYQTSVLDPAYQRPYTLYSNVHITPYQVSGFTNNGVMESKIGAIPWARVRVRLEPEGTIKDTRKGVIQRSWPYVRFGFFYYKGVSGHYGKQAVGCDNDDMTKLINALEGVGSAFGVDYTQIYPYNGTPSGEGVQEAYDYLRQTNTYSNADNSYFIDKGSLKDPYYGANVVGAAAAVPCRKSYVLLLSDGVWNGSVDPIRPARQLHTEDLRSDLDGSQSADVFSILAFSQDLQGYNSMKGVAMFGGFRDITGCGTTGYPYPLTSYPGDSKNMTWPAANCNPSGTYNNCCKEWDTVWDRDEDGTNEQKGDPDNYYEASDGKKLEEALLEVMAAVSSRTAAASAVATVSQEVRSSDIIVRGVFEAADPYKVDTYLWKGHLEAYKPFKVDGEDTYDFEVIDNAGKLCIEITGTRHCWDAGDILRSNIPVNPSQRTIITWDPVNKVQKNFHRDYISRLELNVSTDGDRDNLINWVRGENITGLRQRSADTSQPAWKLGDIVYSTPVIVGPPRLGDVSRRDPNVNQFLQYRDDQKTRAKVVYVGGNDGMLHAFLMSTTDDGLEWKVDRTEDPNIGKELWAYIPSNLLTELKVLANETYGTTGCKHRSMVDLSSRAWEVYIKSPYCGSADDGHGRCWRTVIVGGERGGGDVYFGIDVTNPIPNALDPNSGPKVLWEYSILKNRVVVEAPASTVDPNCVQQCRSNCQNTCLAQYTTCYNDCRATGKSKSKCRSLCEPAQVTCQTTCEAGCESSCTLPPGDFQCYVPFRSAYDSIKLLPMTWSQPYLGRIKVPTSVKFYVGDPNPVTGGQPSTFMQFPTGSDPHNDKRAVVFMGGGIHLYDKNFDSTPAIDSRFKLALFWPFLMMMDIETGNNLLEYVWPVVLNKNIANFNVKTAGANTIPYAMSDPLCLDIWDQENDTIGDDGYIDRIYVGDMNGYLYGIKFNLDDHFPNASTANSNFGMQVEIWPTKPILSDDLGTGDYRSGLQPITVSPVASFEEILSTSTMPALRVIFGTGKYDDIFDSDSDKQDTARMTLYNLRDSIMTEVGGVAYGLPIINTATSHEVYDSTHRTNFRVQFVPRCGLPNNIVSFNQNCDWMRNTTDPDCCQSSCTSSCYQCIYDLRHPCTSGSSNCIFPTDTVDDKPGERILGKPLLAGGLVFFTTFTPPFDPCGYTGQGILYAFNYMCQAIQQNPFEETESLIVPGPAGTTPAGYVAGPPATGVPSRAVLDSRGENVIVQMSDGTLKRHKVDLHDTKPLQFRGWRTR
jgi:type IV pilus assembly protein PilY1